MKFAYMVAKSAETSPISSNSFVRVAFKEPLWIDSESLLQVVHRKLNATSREGRTALMWAVIAHKYRAVEALALLGADPEVREVASSGLIKPGGEEAPKSVRLTPSRTKSNPQLAPTPGPPAHPPTAQAMDHASARSGKDPVLIFIRDYLIAWEKARHRAHHTHRTTLALPTTPDPPPQTHHPTAHHVPPPSPSRPARRASPRLQWRSRAG